MSVLYYIKMDFRSKSKEIIIICTASHTLLMKVCPCERYRQLNSVLYPNNHILKSSKKIFNVLVLRDF